MIVKNDIKSDVEIISMLRQGNRSAWEHLYNKYAAVMYGAILRFTDDQDLAEEILVESFVQLKTKSILASANRLLCLSVLHHTFLVVKRILESRGIALKHDIEANEIYAILNCVIIKQHSLEEIAHNTGTTNEAVKIRLRAELLQLRKDILQKNSV